MTIETIESLQAENLRLRTALAKCGTAVFGIVGPACSVGFLEIIPQEVRLVTERLRRERDCWKANHDARVSAARFLIERADIPLERVRAYEEMSGLQAFHGFFDNRCEGLFMQFGMPAIDAYNVAATAGKPV